MPQVFERVEYDERTYLVAHQEQDRAVYDQTNKVDLRLEGWEESGCIGIFSK